MDKPQNKFLSVVYQLYSIADNGEKTLEEQTGTEKPFDFLTGFGVALDRFEEEVISKQKGEKFDFVLQPSEAFGSYEPNGVHKMPRNIFMINGHFDHDNVFEGAIINLMDNDNHRFMAKVVKVEEDGVTLDTNHPLAGKVLNFVGEVRENRDATTDEVNMFMKQISGGCGCGHNHGEGCGCDGDDCGCGCEGEHHHEDGCGCGHCHH